MFWVVEGEKALLQLTLCQFKNGGLQKYFRNLHWKITLTLLFYRSVGAWHVWKSSDSPIKMNPTTDDNRLLEASAAGQTDRVLQLIEEHGHQLHKYKDQVSF